MTTHTDPAAADCFECIDSAEVEARRYGTTAVVTVRSL